MVRSRSCAVVGCKNRPDSGSKHSFFKFPKDEVLQRKWVAAIGREHVDADKNPLPGSWTPHKRSTVCSDHFRKEDTCLTSRGNTRLYPGVIPSLKLRPKAKETHERPDEEPIPVSLYARKRRCAALGCTNEEDNELDESSANVTFHCFPKRPFMYMKWRNAIGIKDTQRLRNLDICSNHFKAEDFVVGEDGDKKLSTMAVPSRFELPPAKLLHQVEPSAPYLQPRIHLNRCDGPDFDIEEAVSEEQPRLLEPKLEPNSQDSEDDEAEIDVTCQSSVTNISQDHAYNRDLEKHVEQMEQIVEDFKMEVLTACQKVKSLKISVNALKSLYLKEVEALQSIEREISKASQINESETQVTLQDHGGETRTTVLSEEEENPVVLGSHQSGTRSLQIDEGETSTTLPVYFGENPTPLWPHQSGTASSSQLAEEETPTPFKFDEDEPPVAFQLSNMETPMTSQLDGGETSMTYQVNEGGTPKAFQTTGAETSMTYQLNEGETGKAWQMSGGQTSMTYQVNEGETGKAWQMSGGQTSMTYQLNEGQTPKAFQMSGGETSMTYQLDKCETPKVLHMSGGETSMTYQLNEGETPRALQMTRGDTSSS